MFRQRDESGLAAIGDIPTAMKAAAFEVLAEASGARNDLRGHARRAASISAEAAADAMETTLQAGSRTWREAQRQAAALGANALEQARSRPGLVIVGVAVFGLAVGFWLRGASRRALPTAQARRPARASRNGAT
jgi:hypothetical protein